MPDTTNVDVIVFCRETLPPLFLLLHGQPESRYDGQWHVMTGNIQPSETAVQAAGREVLEQIGQPVLACWALDYLHTYYDPAADQIKLTPVLLIEVPSTELRFAAERNDVRWIRYDQAMDILRWPGQRDGLRRAQEDIVANSSRGAIFRTQK